MSIKNIGTHELEFFMICVHKLKHPYRIIIQIMLEAGLRLEETHSLAWCDLLYNGEPKTAIEITAKMAKGERARTIPISKSLSVAIVKEWENAEKNHGMGSGHYVAAKKGDRNPVSTRSIQRQVEKVGMQSLKRRITPHMLRHTFATRLLAVSNLEVVRQALGHKHIGTTQIYVHPTQDDLRQAMDRVPLNGAAQIMLEVKDQPQIPLPHNYQIQA